MKSPGYGLNRSYNCWPMPQPQQLGVWATSVTYNVSHGNARFLTHWVRPGNEPEPSWILVGSLTTEPWRELPPAILLISMTIPLTWKNFYCFFFFHRHLSLFYYLASQFLDLFMGQFLYIFEHLNILILKWKSESPFHVLMFVGLCLSISFPHGF